MLPQFPSPEQVTVTNPGEFPGAAQNKGLLTYGTKKAGLALGSSFRLANNIKRLFSVTVTNTGAAGCYLMIFDKAASPNAGEKPDVGGIPVGGNSIQFFEVATGIPIANGAVTAALSSTQDTYTDLGTNVGNFFFVYSDQP